jgi:PBSX family phage terminase large subunit
MPINLPHLTDKQDWANILATGAYNIWEGSIRSGKTVGTLVYFMHLLRHSPAKGPAVIVGKTKLTIKRNILDPLRQMYGIKIRMGDNETTIFGRKVYIVGANDESSESKIRGGTFALCYGDEITLWPESFFNMLQGRMSVHGAQFIGTTNPDGPRHWLKVNYLDRIKELTGWNIFKFRIEDNEHLAPEFVDGIKKQYTGMWYARFILGKWVAAEGVIWDMFDDKLHVAKVDPTTIVRRIIACDYGTSNPTVFLVIGVTRHDTLVVEREWRWDSRKMGRQMTDAQYSEKLREFIGPTHIDGIVVDPSAASFALQVSRDRIGRVIPADNTVEDGLRNVATLMSLHSPNTGAPLITIDPSCDGLIDEIMGYVWDPKAQEHGEDAPLKINDHGPDALRYGVRYLRGTWQPWVERITGVPYASYSRNGSRAA